MFRFVGRLFGLAIRSRHCLNLSLAPCIWKRLLGEPITVRDIISVDVRTGRVLKVISESADLASLDLPALNINGEYVKPNGYNVDEILNHFLKRWDVQCDAIRRGLACVVPIGKLHLYDAEELERLVTGEKKVDLDLLKANTILEGDNK